MIAPLTPESYHTPAANADFMSVSQYKAWIECAAKQRAVQSGDWMDGDKPAFALGRYVDMALLTPDRFAKDMEANPDTYTYHGKPRVWLADGDAMIERCRKDAYFMATITGQAQQIITFELFGVQWRSMLDVINRETMSLVDLKTTQNIDAETWSDQHEARVPFYETFNYWMQFAVYREAVRSIWGEYPRHVKIAAVSKQDPPDVRVIAFNDALRFKRELNAIQNNLPRIMAMKRGTVPATRCESCDYCRSTRVLTADVVARSVDTEMIKLEEYEEMEAGQI